MGKNNQIIEQFKKDENFDENIIPLILHPHNTNLLNNKILYEQLAKNIKRFINPYIIYFLENELDEIPNNIYNGKYFHKYEFKPSHELKNYLKKFIENYCNKFGINIEPKRKKKFLRSKSTIMSIIIKERIQRTQIIRIVIP